MWWSWAEIQLLLSLIFSFFENTIIIGFLGVCWLPLSCIPNLHSPLLVVMGLVGVSSRKFLGYDTSGGNLHILGLRNKHFSIWFHASVDMLPSTSQNNPLLDQGFASPAAGRSHPGHWYTWGDPPGNLKELSLLRTLLSVNIQQDRSASERHQTDLKGGWKKILNGFWRWGSRGGRAPSWIPRVLSRCLGGNARFSGGSLQNEPS